MDRVDLHWKRIVSADQEVGIICRLGQMWLPTFSSLHNLCLCCLLILFLTILLIHLIADPLFALSFQGHCHMVGEEGDFFSSLCYSLSGYLFFRLSHCQKKLVSFYSLYSYSLLDYLKGGGNERHFYPLD